MFLYRFNLQGIFGTNIGGTNLWFLTLIMLCYIITPILQNIKDKNPSKKIVIGSIITTMIAQIIFAYTTDVGMTAGHTISWCILAFGVYIIGYFAGNMLFEKALLSSTTTSITIVTIIASVIVLVANRLFDGQIIYDRVIIYYGVIVIDYWICMMLYKLGTHINGGIINIVLDHLDVISYEFYIVHGLILASITLDILWLYGSVLYIIATLLYSYIAAWILHGICSVVYKSLLLLNN